MKSEELAATILAKATNGVRLYEVAAPTRHQVKKVFNQLVSEGKLFPCCIPGSTTKIYFDSSNARRLFLKQGIETLSHIKSNLPPSDSPPEIIFTTATTFSVTDGRSYQQLRDQHTTINLTTL